MFCTKRRPKGPPRTGRSLWAWGWGPSTPTPPRPAPRPSANRSSKFGSRAELGGQTYLSGDESRRGGGRGGAALILGFRSFSTCALEKKKASSQTGRAGEKSDRCAEAVSKNRRKKKKKKEQRMGRADMTTRSRQRRDRMFYSHALKVCISIAAPVRGSEAQHSHNSFLKQEAQTMKTGSLRTKHLMVGCWALGYTP